MNTCYAVFNRREISSGDIDIWYWGLDRIYSTEEKAKEYVYNNNDISVINSFKIEEMYLG